MLLPIYGIMVPFHILTIKNATNNQDGDHAYIRINFNFGTSYEPTAKFPNALFLKELSFRSSDPRRASKVRLLLPAMVIDLRVCLLRMTSGYVSSVQEAGCSFSAGQVAGFLTTVEATACQWCKGLETLSDYDCCLTSHIGSGFSGAMEVSTDRMLSDSAG